MWIKRKRRMMRPTPYWLIRLGNWEHNLRMDIADWLGRKAAKFSMAQLSWRFVCFLAVMGLFNTLILVEVVRDPLRWPEFESVQLPKLPQKDKPAGPVPPLTFQAFVDSIRKIDRLRKSYDSLLRVRPGFADTIRQLEEIYSADRRGLGMTR